MSASDIDTRAEAVRRFNRFYTRLIGILNTHYLESPFTLSEARVLYEIAQHDAPTATLLGSQLGLDAGQLSRMLRDFQQQGLIDSQPAPGDGRKRLLRLTEPGRQAFDRLNTSSHNGIAEMLNQLPAADQERLVAAMSTIERLLGSPDAQAVTYVLRPPQPGDLGWVVQLHGALYAQEYHWNEEFEALVVEIVAGFARQHDPKRERCWIAEVDGEKAGSVFVVKKSETEAKLRLLLVTPRARGLGLGTRLVEECIRFARQAGYRKLILWTNSNLTAARHIYTKTGFRLVESEAHHSFGYDLIGENWELDL